MKKLTPQTRNSGGMKAPVIFIDLDSKETASSCSTMYTPRSTGLTKSFGPHTKVTGTINGRKKLGKSSSILETMKTEMSPLRRALLDSPERKKLAKRKTMKTSTKTLYLIDGFESPLRSPDAAGSLLFRESSISFVDQGESPRRSDMLLPYMEPLKSII